MYSSVLSAVVSALAAETIDNTAKQAWQKLYRPGHEDGVPLASLMSRHDVVGRAEADCWVYARLHSLLIPRHWNVLVAKYSTHKGRKIQATCALIPLIASPAPHLFVSKAVAAWAIPPMKGKEGRRSSDVAVLPKAFYDMNGWDPEAHPERTRRRWRSGIAAVLDEMVGEALAAAGTILAAEGLLFDDAA